MYLLLGMAPQPPIVERFVLAFVAVCIGLSLTGYLTYRLCKRRPNLKKWLKRVFLVVYVSIVATLILVALQLMDPNYHAPVSETKITMQIIYAAIEEYRKDQALDDYEALTPDNWVSQLSGSQRVRSIIAPLSENIWSHEHKNELRDGWDHPIVFSPDAGSDARGVLTSAGPDGDMTTEDDNVRYPALQVDTTDRSVRY